MKKNRLFWLVLLPLLQSAVAEESISILYNERLPYLVSSGDGTVRGLTGTPASDAFVQAKIPHVWIKTPSNRQLALLKLNAEKACAVGWFKNSEREAFARYTKPIYQDSATIGLALASNNKISEVSRISDILVRQELLLIAKSGYSYGAYIDGLIKKLSPKLKYLIVENTRMIKLVRAGRADYFFITEDEADGLIKSMNYDSEEFRYLRFADAPKENFRYILCSKSVPAAVLEALNRHIPEISR